MATVTGAAVQDLDIATGDKGVFGFGRFLLDPVRRRLTLDGEAVKLPPTQFDTLLYLVRNPGRVVEKDELLAAVWGGRIIEESNLSQAIYLLRRALQQGNGGDTYIVTAPGRGYRFAAEVDRADDDPPQQSSISSLAQPPAGQARSAPIRLAKLTPPRLPLTVARPRLFSLMARGSERKIVWVSAPPGSGKTTLVSSFLEDCGLVQLWYGVDAGDADVASFFYYLGQAVRAARPEAAGLPLLTTEYLRDIPGFTRRFFRTLAGIMASPFVLVLDNAQEVPEPSPLAEILRDAAEEAGAGACLIVISRQDPPAAFARLRANQDLMLIGWEQLRLTEAETGEIVERHDPELAADAATLHTRSGGWAAGLTLLLQGRTDDQPPASALSSQTPQAVFDYFATELLAAASPDTRHALLSTALLPRFTAKEAVLLSERDRAGHLVDGLARRRMFTDRTIAEDTHFQYHALFREFLRSQLNLLFSPEERRQLTLRSARVARDAGDLETALGLFEDGQDWEAAGALLLAHAPGLFVQGRSQTLRSWLLRQPPERLEAEPWLAYWLGVCAGQADPPAGRAALEQAYERFLRAGDRTGQVLSACAIVESHLFAWGVFFGLDHWIDILERLVEAKLPLPSEAVSLRVHSVLLLALANFRPQHRLVSDCICTVWHLCHQDIAAGDRVMAASTLVLALGWGAAATDGRRAIAEFDHLAARPEITPLQRFTWLSSKSFVTWGEDETATWGSLLRTAGAIARDAGLKHLVALAYLQEIRQPLIERRLDVASDMLRMIERDVASSPPMVAPLFLMLRGWLLVLQGELKQAMAYVERCVEAGRGIGNSTRKLGVLIVYAVVMAENGRLDQALAAAQEASAWYKLPGDGMFRFASLLIEADILARLGRQQDYLDVLTEALATGRRGGHFEAYAWFPDIVSRLATTAVERDIEVDYVAKLIRLRKLHVIRKEAVTQRRDRDGSNEVLDI